MMNKNERMEMLQKAGVNTGKYFTVDLPEGLGPNTKIHIVIDENGAPMIVNDTVQNDPIAEQIIGDGYVRNTKLHRRFVMAQMFQMLGYISYNGEEGYTACLNRMYGYGYTLKMMLEEVRVLSKLEVRDRDSFIERSHFFTKDIVAAVLEDYLEKLKEYVKALPNHNCKGVPYKRIKNTNIFVADLNKKVFAPVENYILHVKYARSYTEMYTYLKRFMDNAIQLPYNTTKSKAWVDAFKGEGAYYTLKNLVMFHGCDIEVAADFGYKYKVSGKDAVQVLNGKLNEYQGEGWRMFAFMKKVIDDNNFNFYKRMQEVYNK